MTEPDPAGSSARVHDEPRLLDVRALTTIYADRSGEVRAADAVSFAVDRGETFVLVGESGCGKSATALSLLRLIAPPGRIAAGRILFEGRDLLGLPEDEMTRMRGARIGMVFQEPMTALNPVFTVGDQVADTLLAHGRATRRNVGPQVLDLLEAVRMPNPGACARDYPHQLSGGMRQRALIAIALAGRPALLVADEPTTALDATIQAEILDLLAEMRERFALALLLITHDLGVAAAVADRVGVMYAGRLIEQGDARAVFEAPAHPYTRGLLATVRHEGGGHHLAAIPGTVPDPRALPRGCAFEPRCPERLGICREERPERTDLAPGREVLCHRHRTEAG